MSVELATESPQASSAENTRRLLHAGVSRQWQGVTLINADCLDMLPEIACDVVVTDPPYGTGKYALDDDSTVCAALNPWPRKAVFGYPETLCGWCATLGKPDEWVTWWPVNKQIRRIKKLTSETEAIAIWGETYEVPMRPRSNTSAFGKKIAAQRGLDPENCKDGDVWRDSSPGTGCNGHIRNHPNEKPVSIMEKLVKLCSTEGETVCDPYMGSGTTGIACIRTGRKFIGIEKDPKHFQTAVERIERELAQGVLLPANTVLGDSVAKQKP